MYPSILLTISTSTPFYRKDVLFSSENRTSFALVHKVNPRLCRGQKKAYGEGKSRQEKVSELE